MLQIHNLTKIYKPKKGVPVVALDHISLTLPDRGLVFLLGKSGSGKSTLLNLLGGLDSYDDGEILIKGNSSRGFHQQHFDSYRNTYVGFVFQEYNILEEFTVGANIALAIELQGIKATDQQINAILKELDLEGYGGRRPNELSGGQKQRVAIARALVKQPRIIMADEPTGALDSNTGRQIFDTLKRLSADRLVIVVSHDREFAEQYADRIIELADGRVISDLTYEAVADTESPTPLTYEGDTVHIAAGYHLTEDDRQAINAYITALQTGAKLQLRGSATGKRAIATDNTAIRTDNTGFRLIKSRLPMHSAFKIGASSLKHKRFRLVVTILLSCIAFGLFGLADTFGAYNHIQACTDSLIDSHVGYASLSKAVLDERYDYYRGGYHITDAELAAIGQESGVSVKGIHRPLHEALSVYDALDFNKFEETEGRVLYLTEFNGFSEITAAELPEYDYDLIAGQLPDGGRDEVAVSAYAADTFVTFGLRNPDTGALETIGAYKDLVGKKLAISDTVWTISGVVDTHFDLSRYELLRTEPENESTAQQLVRFALEQELYYAQQYSLHPTLLTGSGRVQRMTKAAYTVRELNNAYLYFEDKNGSFAIDPYCIGSLTDAKGATIHWLDGVSRTTLGEKEIVITLDTMDSFNGDVIDIGKGGAEDMSVSTDTSDSAAVTQMLNNWLQENGPLREFSDRCYDEEGNRITIDDYTIVGYIDPATKPALMRTVLTHESLRDALTEHDEGPYSLAVGVMPTEETDVKRLVSYCYGDKAVRFQLQNAVTYELDTIHEVLVVLADVFLYIGLGFALFAALMLTNFISTSISYKKQEIGILRAIGSRSNDVFRIFFSESFLIAMINFVLSGIGVGAATGIINHLVRNQLNILVTVLHFGARQILLLLAVSLLVAAVASFFPVYRIAAKRPIDAIRNR